MTKELRRFILQNILTSACIILLGALLFSGVLESYYHPVYPLIHVVTLLLNLSVFYFFIRSDLSGNKINIAIVKSFVFKFFSYILITVIFLLIEDDSLIRVTFIIVLFVFYSAFTILEVISITRVIKREKNFQ